jgi:hypothetical protein
MAMRGRWLIFPVVLLVAAGSAVAQTAPATPAAPKPAVVAACRGDIQRLCTGVEPGGGRIGECMRAHGKELSPGCVKAVRESRRPQ